MMQIVPLNNDKPIVRGIVNANEDNLTDRMIYSFHRVGTANTMMVIKEGTYEDPKVVEYYDRINDEETTKFILRETNVIDHDGTVLTANEEDIGNEVEVEVEVDQVDQVGQEGPAGEVDQVDQVDQVKKVGPSSIVRNYLLSGVEFIRQELIDEVQALDPTKDKKKVLNTVGALMHTIAISEKLIKNTKKNETKVTVFWYTKAE